MHPFAHGGKLCVTIVKIWEAVAIDLQRASRNNINVPLLTSCQSIVTSEALAHRPIKLERFDLIAFNFNQARSIFTIYTVSTYHLIVHHV